MRPVAILVVLGGLVAIVGSALLRPGLGQLLLGMVGFVLVLAALAVLRKGRVPAGKALFTGESAEAPPSVPEDDRPPAPDAEAPPPTSVADRRLSDTDRDTPGSRA